MGTGTEKGMALLRAVACAVAWSAEVTPFFAPSEAWFHAEVMAYIAAMFDETAAVEEVYPHLANELEEEIGSCTPQHQERFRHILYLAVAAKQDKGRRLW